jgi:hypothetical protein
MRALQIGKVFIKDGETAYNTMPTPSQDADFNH